MELAIIVPVLALIMMNLVSRHQYAKSLEIKDRHIELLNRQVEALEKSVELLKGRL